MTDDLNRFYRTLGYRDPRLSPSRVGRHEVGLEGNLGESLAIVDEGARPILPDEVDELRRQLKADPVRVGRSFAALLSGQSYTDAEAIQLANDALDYLERAFQDPGAAADRLEGLFTREHNDELPHDFTFPLYDEDRIPIRPSLNSTKFQTREDWWGYVVLPGAAFHLGTLKLAPLRWHTDYSSRFTYPLLEPTQEHPVEIALFADFANGLYHARYIARQLEVRRYPYAVHLGDVYYAGTMAEFTEYLEEPLRPLLSSTELFLLAGNHELYSRGIPFLKYLDQKRERLPGRQKQEGSYFRLISERFQVIGMDTEWWVHGRMHPDHIELLRSWLFEGRARGAMNVLLTSFHGFDYGKQIPTTLFTGDLRRLLRDQGLVDLWFWGNVHQCALYGPSEHGPFISSCVGHGGYPEYVQKAGLPTAAPIRFVETEWRFAPYRHVREDVANNGYCVLRLCADGSAQLVYLDWRGRERHTAQVTRDDDGNVGFLE